MALPQTVDPSTLNLSGKPAIATAPTTTITTPESKGMAMPAIENVTHSVNPLIGGAVGALVGQMLANKYAAQGSGGAGTGGASGAGGGGNILDSIMKAITGKGTASGNIGSVNNVIVPSGMSGTEAQNWLNQNYGMTNGQPNYVVSGTNLSTGEIVGLPNYNIGPNYGGGTSTGGGSTGSLTNIGNNYFTDNNNNVYDANGNLIYQNPSNISGSQTEPSGGGYDSTQNQYFQTDAGDIYDGLGNLVLAFNNGYYYEPDTGNFYDATTFDPVGSDFNAYTDYFNIPTLDTSGYDNLGDYFDYGNYTSGSTTYIKDGGSVNKGGLPTPLFAEGGNVDGYADGGNSIIDAATAMAPSTALGSSTPVATSSSVPNTAGTSGGTGMLGSLLNFAASNPMLTGAGLGALVTALVNESSAIPTNRPVDMTALGTLKPRTTTVGSARYVPYSEYGTPTSSFDYSKLYENLGVSPFGGGVVSPTPTSATPTPTTPTSALSGLTPIAPRPTTPVVAPSGSVTAPTTTTPTAPTYYSDADGNIYDADGNLVYDTTAGSTTASTGASVAPTTGTLAPTGAGDAYYSYGTPVDPSTILKSKNGGLAKMADGGTTNGLDVDYQTLFDTIMQNTPNMESADLANLIATDPYRAKAMYNAYTFQSPTLTDKELLYGTGSAEGNYYDGLYHPNYTGISTGLSSEETITPREVYTPLPYERNDVSVTSTGTDFPPVMYNQGMPQQVEDLMPTQGPAMPQQTPFSTSPTFRFSGANNPLLTGLRQQVPGQQPFMLNPAGQFVPREEISTSRQYGYALGGQPIVDNLNVPVSNKPFANVPAIQGRGDYRQGAYVEGEGDGQSDDIPAMLADGEYVIDAETVAQLGNGSNKAGAKVLDEFRKNIRAHKRGAPHDKIPPKSKSALAYLKGAK